MLAAMDYLSRMRYGEARRCLMEQFKIGRATATRDIQEAQRLFGLEIDERMMGMRAIAVARLERVMDKAEQAGKYEAVIRAQREITRITGIAAPIEHKLSGDVGLDFTTIEKIGELSDEELDIASRLDGVKSRVPKVKTLD